MCGGSGGGGNGGRTGGGGGSSLPDNQQPGEVFRQAALQQRRNLNENITTIETRKARWRAAGLKFIFAPMGCDFSISGN